MQVMETLKESLHFYNPWWETGKIPSELLEEYKRPVLKNLVSYLSLDRIIVLKGPRRTGKTTLFYHIVDYLLKERVAPTDILFVSLDDLNLRTGLDEIFKAYQETNKRLIKQGKTVYVLLDEVHFLKDWQFYVKRYFERKYPLKFLVSGSAATLIRKGTESLAGRTVEETVYPFSFYEFLCYRLKNPKLIKIIDGLKSNHSLFNTVNTTDLVPYITEIKICFEDYLEKGGFPNLFGVQDRILWKKLVREDILEKVIYRDLVELYGIKKPQVLEKLFLYLVDITSQILSVTNIANSLKLSRECTEKYLLYLEHALLIKRIRKYSKSAGKTARSGEKVHVIDPGLVNAFSRVEIGHVLESTVAGHALRQADLNIYYFRDKNEVDLVLERDKNIFPVEVKYKNEIHRRDLNGLYSFIRKFGAKTLIVITRDLMKEESFNETKIIYFPAWLFLLLFDGMRETC